MDSFTAMTRARQSEWSCKRRFSLRDIMLVVTVLLVMSETKCSAQSSSSTVTLLEKHGYLLIVPVAVNGMGPFNFVVDTGSSITMVDAELFRRLSLVERGKQPMAGVLGIPTRSWSTVHEMRVGDASAQDLPVISMEQILLPHSWLRIDGVLGDNFLDRFDILIDNQTRSISFSKDEDLASRVLGNRLAMTTTSSVGPERFHHRPLLTMKIPSYRDQPLRLLLDSGAEVFTVLASYPTRAEPREAVRVFQTGITFLGGTLSCTMWRGAVTAEHLSLENLSITACARPAGEALDNEGSLPTILFKRIFISHLHSYVIFNPYVLKPTEMASDSDVHGAKQ
jgi:hypothetical protein